MYDLYAQFYDGTGQIRYSLLFYQYLQELWATHPLPQHTGVRSALDLGCGTATLSLLLADAGWRAAGLDLSQAMVAQGQQKADALGLEVVLTQGDMRAIGGRWHDLDLVTCLYDSLNYLLEDSDLLACFRGVAAALRPGGLFIADLNSRHVLRDVWVGAEVHEQPGYVQVQQISFDAARDRSMLLLTGMVGSDEQGYTRFDERHEQRAYDRERVEALLAEAGLAAEACYDAFTTASPDHLSQRFIWVSRRT